MVGGRHVQGGTHPGMYISLLTQRCENLPVLPWGLSIVALLRCLIWREKEEVYALRC